MQLKKLHFPYFNENYFKFWSINAIVELFVEKTSGYVIGLRKKFIIYHYVPDFLSIFNEINNTSHVS